MTAPTCDHCLRPDFTRRLAKDLLADRRPLNLIGAPGQGRGRLLADLQRLDQGGTRWLCADLKAHRYSFPGLLKTLWDQTGLPGAQPRTLGTLVERLAAEDRPACLLLHHFDAVLNEPDVGAGFDVGFLDALNALKNRGIGLLCVTEQAHARYVMVTRAGERRLSTLVLEREDLRPLTQAEIAAELGRCLPALGDDDRARLGGCVLEHPLPVPFLKFVTRRIEDGEGEGRRLARRLKGWHREFAEQGRGIGTADALGLRRTLRAWGRALGLHRVRWPLAGIGKAIERWLNNRGKGG